LNGDTYLATGYRALVEAHRLHVQRSDAIGSLGLVKAPDMQRYGQVVLDDDRRITAFREKQPAPSGAGLISAGAYVLEPTVLNHIPAGRPVSIEQETFPELAERRVLRGIPIEGDFVDMGTPGGHAALEALLR
jgi:mannose-1-phosphate guanylyltransferase